MVFETQKKDINAHIIGLEVGKNKAGGRCLFQLSLAVPFLQHGKRGLLCASPLLLWVNIDYISFCRRAAALLYALENKASKGWKREQGHCELRMVRIWIIGVTNLLLLLLHLLKVNKSCFGLRYVFSRVLAKHFWPLKTESLWEWHYHIPEGNRKEKAKERRPPQYKGEAVTPLKSFMVILSSS